MSANAGAGRYSYASSVGVNTTGSIFIQPPGSGTLHAGDAFVADDGAILLYSASGHNHAPVPEPAGSALWLAGMLALVACRRGMAARAAFSARSR
jgi:hypothetical protein